MDFDTFLKSHTRPEAPFGDAVAQTVREIARTARSVWRISQDPTVHDFSGVSPGVNPDGDAQTTLDVAADAMFLNAARRAPVAAYASEELAEPCLIDASRPLALAIDPHDGSANVAYNLSFATIFSILPYIDAPKSPHASFLQPGHRQLAAGIVVYGPQLLILLTLGSGTSILRYSESRDGFEVATDNTHVPAEASEFAINASNYWHWQESVRLYVDDCLRGEAGPQGRTFNMRWLASVGLDAYRICVRGGVFLYPADQRKGYGNGRLRLIYEANPIALLMEQAGGSTTDCVNPILSLKPEELHQRVPLVFGSKGEVELIARYHTNPSAIEERAPLFGTRSLFRP